MLVLKKKYDIMVKGFKKSLELLDNQTVALENNLSDSETENFRLQNTIRKCESENVTLIKSIDKLRNANRLQVHDIDKLNDEINRLNNVIKESSKKFESKKNKAKK